MGRSGQRNECVNSSIDEVLNVGYSEAKADQFLNQINYKAGGGERVWGKLCWLKEAIIYSI